MSAALAVFALLPSAQAGVAARVNQAKVNVRGQASFLGEVITQIQKGEEVVILEEIAVAKPKPGEPTNWAKIKMPANTPVWVFANFLDGAKVKARKLNLRAGPGENYSVVGRLEKGDEVKPIRTVDEWVEVETPDQAYAFVDAALLDVPNGTTAPQALPPAVAATTVPVAEATPAKSPEPEKPAAEPAPAEKQATREPVATSTEPAPAPAASNPPPAQATPEPERQPDKPQVAEEKSPVAETKPVQPESAPAQQQPVKDTSAPIVFSPAPTPPPQAFPVVAAPVVVDPAPAPLKRVVRREGVVRATRWNIQAPTEYVLENTENGVDVNFLHNEKSAIKLKDYLRRRVIVTGEESIDPRYEKIPVLEVETLEVAP